MDGIGRRWMGSEKEGQKGALLVSQMKKTHIVIIKYMSIHIGSTFKTSTLKIQNDNPILF